MLYLLSEMVLAWRAWVTYLSGETQEARSLFKKTLALGERLPTSNLYDEIGNVNVLVID